MSIINNKTTDYKEAAIICMLRKNRFCENYSNEKELNTLINLFFPVPDMKQNTIHQIGLRKAHQNMYDYVIENNLIGLILYGEKYGSNDTIFDYFPCGGYKKIPISIKSVCNVFLNEFIDENTIKSECFKIPFFDNYYSNK